TPASVLLGGIHSVRGMGEPGRPTITVAKRSNPLRDRARPSQVEWVLTEEAFTKFLACLDTDPARAGEKYEALRETLVKFLDWRGALFPEELVDEIFNPVTPELEEGGPIRGVPNYCHGVARMGFPSSIERSRHEPGQLRQT